MSKNIKISKKHGLNPSMDTCFFCGEARGIVLFGALKGDAEAPRNVLLDYEPCDACKAKMSQGTTIICVTKEDNGNAPIQEGVYPVGPWCVLRAEAAQRIFGTDERNILLQQEIYEQLTGGINND